MAKLRVVAPGDGDVEVTMTEALESIVRECLADAPSCVFVAWEVKGKVTVRSLPDSLLVQKGFVHTLFERLFETEDEDG